MAEGHSGEMALWPYDEINPPIMLASAIATKLSVLSSMSATRGWLFASTRLEKSGGIVRTPLTRPLRRSAIAWPWSE
jgi:hypothetical protein